MHLFVHSFRPNRPLAKWWSSRFPYINSSFSCLGLFLKHSVWQLVHFHLTPLCGHFLFSFHFTFFLSCILLHINYMLVSTWRTLWLPLCFWVHVWSAAYEAMTHRAPRYGFHPCGLRLRATTEAKLTTDQSPETDGEKSRLIPVFLNNPPIGRPATSDPQSSGELQHDLLLIQSVSPNWVWK